MDRRSHKVSDRLMITMMVSVSKRPNKARRRHPVSVKTSFFCCCCTRWFNWWAAGAVTVRPSQSVTAATVPPPTTPPLLTIRSDCLRLSDVDISAGCHCVNLVLLSSASCCCRLLFINLSKTRNNQRVMKGARFSSEKRTKQWQQ